MSPRTPTATGPARGFPRLRGDEPAELSGYAMKDEFSPPTRG